MRKQIAAGNWKMNTTLNDAIHLAKDILETTIDERTLVILAVPATHLQSVNVVLKDKTGFYTAAQNCSEYEKGAYTGEISAKMIKEIGVDYVILGHSERREYFGETDEIIASKLNRALSEGLKVIYCCGEKLQTRKANEHVDFVSDQIKKALFQLSAEQLAHVVIAYEPVWAIGTGETASPEQAQEMHSAIRNLFVEEYGSEVANAIPILYGGSCKPTNAEELFTQPDVDGGLVGGASLDSESFISIINAF